jgi:uncharacterized protein (TIRG00374 family)
MKISWKQLLKYAPLLLGLLILGVGSVFVPWHEVLPYLKKLSPFSYGLIVILGSLFYLSRAFRYRYMLGVLNAPKSLPKTLIAYLEAQPVSLLPAGEAYRTVTLKERVDVPYSKGVPVVFIQSFTENVGLITLALVSAVILQQQALLLVVLAAVYVLILILLRARRTADRSRRVLNRIPFVNLARGKFVTFIGKNRELLSGKSLAVLLLTGLISSFIASLLLMIIANDMGITLNYAQAVIAFSLPTTLQNVTFLPGGIGVNEQSSVGILIILGANLPAAVALTLIMRLVTLGLGIILGLIVIGIARTGLIKE